MYHGADPEVPVSRGDISHIDVFPMDRNGLREFQIASLGNECLAPGSRIDSDYFTGKPDVGDDQIAVLSYRDAQWVAESGAKVPAF
jgi:hypothetical protein